MFYLFISPESAKSHYIINERKLMLPNNRNYIYKKKKVENFTLKTIPFLSLKI